MGPIIKDDSKKGVCTAKGNTTGPRADIGTKDSTSLISETVMGSITSTRGNFPRENGMVEV